MLIGIHGKQGTGKSRLAKELWNHIMTKTDHKSFVKSLATPVKHILEICEEPTNTRSVDLHDFYYYALGLNPYQADRVSSEIEEVYQDNPSVPGTKNRKMLQIIGTELGRDYLGADIWVRYLLKSISGCDDYFVFVDDARFMNELEVCDFKIKLDHRLNLRRWQNICEQKGYNTEDTHESEKGLDNDLFDLVLKPYEYDVKEIFAEVLKRKG